MSTKNRPKNNLNLFVTPPPQQNQNDLVSFNFSFMEEKWSNTHKGFTTIHYKQFLEKMKTFSKMSWQNALAPNSAGRKYKKINELRFNAKLNIPQKFQSESSMLFFRYYDTRSLIGYRENDIFYVVWIESSPGDIYDHGT